MIAIIVTMFMVPAVSFSEVKKQDNTDQVIEEIRQAFGMPSEPYSAEDQGLSLIKRLEAERRRSEHSPQLDDNEDSRR